MPTPGEWNQRFARFITATPELIAGRGLQQRGDTKFVMPKAAAFDLLGSLHDHYAVLRTAAGGVLAAYDTVYFDTAELALFHAHRRGYRVRHKVRVRHYADRAISVLEVKTRRSELLTEKVSRPHAYRDDAMSLQDRTFVHARTGLRRELWPQARVTYRRLTLLGLDTHERVTLDLDLCFGPAAAHRAAEGLAIVEVKQPQFSGHTPAMCALRAGGWQPGWSSKYCAAIAATRPAERRNRLLPGLRPLLGEAA